MLIGINQRHQIKQLREITDESLTVINLDETSEFYPFKGWTDERILCYCYKADENGIAIYPYVDTQKIDEIESEVLKLQSQVIDLEFEKIGGLI